MLRRPHKVVLACLVLLLFAVALYSGRQIQQLPGRAVLPAAGSTVLPPPTATSIAPSGGHTPPPLTTAPTNRAMQPPMERPTAPIEHSVADQAPTATATSSGEAGVLPLVIQRVETTRPYVALTVDDFYTGDYRRRTAIRILTAANAAHATLTLFPAGSALDSYAHHYPDQAAEIKELVAAGSYEIADHTYSHPMLPKTGEIGGVGAEVGEITRGAAAIQQFFGRLPERIFRPPFGSWDDSVRQAAAEAGFPTIVTWSVDSGDSEGPEKPAERLLMNAGWARAGDIILMHANRTSSADALPLIIDMLRKKGLQLVGLSTLLQSGQPVYTLQPTYVDGQSGLGKTPESTAKTRRVPYVHRPPIPTNRHAVSTR